ncbi:MAG: preprotein translocase subunit SecG [Candidatus Omnitrophica bacterium]|nr:preprotein translocase subunit SecG [Candidatus Omnitrophota bacterium]
MILYGLVIAIHVIASLVLIAVILLQAGRGGGLSESFGASSTQSILGTKTSVFLKRATAASAIIYIITCLSLAVMTSHRGRSLVARSLVTTPAGAHGQAPAGQAPFANEPVDY